MTIWYSILVRRVNTMARAHQADVFTSLAAAELERFESIIADLHAGSVTITGGHDEFVMKLCSYLSTLSKGDEDWTVTIPDFWTADNLGVQGRYLSMNAEIVRRGAIVQRVFLLTEVEMRDANVLAIVDAHRDIQRHLEAQGPKVRGVMDVRYKLVTETGRQRAIAAGDQQGMWIKGDSLVRVKALYNDSRRITAVNIRKVLYNKEQLRKNWFDPYFSKAKPLTSWASDF